jgi:Baculovirus F protein
MLFQHLAVLLLVLNFSVQGNSDLHHDDLQQGLVFLQRDTILMTADSWCVVVDVNVNSYINNIRSFQTMATSFSPPAFDRYSDNLSSVDSELMKVTDKSVVTLRNKAGNLVEKLVDLKLSMTSIATSHRSKGTDSLDIHQRRPTRGILDVGGKVLNFLFGILTTTHYDQLNTKIEALDQSQDKIQHIIAEQLTIVNHSYFQVSAMRSHVNKVDAEINFLKQDFSSFQKNVKTEFARVETRFIYLARASRVTRTMDMLYDQLHGDVQQLLHAFLHASMGKLDSYFLPYDTYLELAKQIQSALPRGKEMVTHDDSGVMRLYYSLATLSAFEYKGNLRLFIEFPILNKQRLFSVYEPVYLPTQINSSDLFFAILPKTELFAVSHDMEYYFSLSKAELSTCQQLAMTVCHPMRTISRKNVPDCHYSLFSGDHTNVEQLCSIQTYKNFLPIFYKPENSFDYIYSVPKRTAITGTCDRAVSPDIFPSAIEGTGRISIPPSCVALGDTFVLLGNGLLNVGNVKIKNTIDFPRTPALPSISDLGKMNISFTNEKYRVLNAIFPAENSTDEPQGVALSVLMDEIQRIHAGPAVPVVRERFYNNASFWLIFAVALLFVASLGINLLYFNSRGCLSCSSKAYSVARPNALSSTASNFSPQSTEMPHSPTIVLRYRTADGVEQELEAVNVSSSHPGRSDRNI